MDRQLIRLIPWEDVRGDGDVKRLLFTLKEVADFKGVSVATIKKWLKNGKLVGNILTRERNNYYGNVLTKRQGVTYNINGEQLTISEIAIKLFSTLSQVKYWAQLGELEERYNLYSHVNFHLVNVERFLSTTKFTYERINILSIEDFLLREIRKGLEMLWRNIRNVALQKVALGIGLIPRSVVLRFALNEMRGINSDGEVNISRGNLFEYRTIKINGNGRIPIIISFEEFKTEVEKLRYRSETLSSDAMINNFFIDPLSFAILCDNERVIGRTPFEFNLNAKDHFYFVLGEVREKSKLHNNSCFFDSVLAAIRIIYKGGDSKEKNSIIRQIKSIAHLYQRGVTISDIVTIVNELRSFGVKIHKDPEWDGKKKIFIENVYKNIPAPSNSKIVNIYVEIYHDVMIDHFYTIVDRKAIKKKICSFCGKRFDYSVQLKKHVKECPKQNVEIKEINEINEEEKLKTYIYYDIETIRTNQCGDLSVYAVGWSQGGHYRDSFGEHSLSTFVENWTNKDNSLEKVIVAFNGSRFDLWLVLREAYKQGWISSKVTASKGVIYGVTLYKKVNKEIHVVKVWDPILHFKGSLEDVARSFQIPNALKCDLNHDSLEEDFLGRGWEALKEKEEEIKIYLKQDVQILEGIMNKIPIENFSYSTAASMAWKVFNKYYLDKEKIPEIEEEMIPFFRSAVIGGRTQAFENGYIEEDLEMLDVVSLYPSAMYNNYYPIGKYIKTSVEVVGKIGIYNVKIKYQRLPVIVGRKRKNCKIDWNYTGEMDIVTSTITIEMLRRHFGDDCLEIGSGVYWEESTNDIFTKYIDNFLSIKIQEDRYKEKKDGQYNPVRRENAKLMLNSLYGKLLERDILETCNFVTTSNSAYVFKESLSHHETKPLSSNLEFISGVKKRGFINRKPLYLGVLILDYSKKNMYDNIFSKIPVIYSDTDSCLIRTTDSHKLDRKIFGKELGQFSDETPGHKIKYAYIVEPKKYALGTFEEDGSRSLIKMRMNGVNINKSIWINLKTGQKGDRVNEYVYRVLCNLEKNIQPSDIQFNSFHFTKKLDLLELKKIDSQKILCKDPLPTNLVYNRLTRFIDEFNESNENDLPFLLNLKVNINEWGQYECLVDPKLDLDKDLELLKKLSGPQLTTNDKAQLDRKELEQKSVVDLKVMCKEKNLRVGGKKADLIERVLNIQKNLKEQWELNLETSTSSQSLSESGRLSRTRTASSTPADKTP